MIKKIVLVLILVNQFCFSQEEQNNKPKINAVGMGMVSAFPNAAEITISLEHLKPTLREAVNENQKTADEVLKIISNYVVDKQDIKTSLISTNKSTRWNEKLNKEVFVGFESSQKIVFTLKDLNKMQDFTEDLLKTKFNKIQRISYFNTDSQDLIKKSQELAIQDAIETTNRIANVANVKLGKILYIVSNNSPNDDASNRINSYQFETFGKGMGGRGVSSSGELIKYPVSVTIYTEILE
ncbi:SIMPL domain-containing protein [Flavobacterium sp. GCM10027622]|uniref:SIMPL domain-containing protein n=1 Tax=unclassified Flavobacterium TaxID=196869 RepID=UPI0036226353